MRSAGLIMQILVALIMTPLIMHSLGDRLYGFWILIGTFVGYFGLLDFGLSLSVQRFVSRALGRSDLGEVNAIVNTSLFMFLAAGILVLIVSGTTAVFADQFIINSDDASLFRKVILVLGLAMAFGFPARVFSGILSSHLRYDLIMYASTARMVIANASLYYFLKQGAGIWALTIISFLASLLEYGFITLFAFRVFRELDIGVHFFAKDKVKILFEYSSKTFVTQLADIIRFRVDVLVIAAFTGVSLVTYYSIGARLIELFTGFITSSMGVMTPVFSNYEGRGDYAAIRAKFVDVTKISTIASVYIGVSILYYGKPFIRRWMGPGFESSYYVAAILCVPYIIALMQSPSIGLLYGISKHHFYAVSNILEGLLNLVVSIVLVKKYGIYGVALGTAIAMVIFKLFVQPVFTCRSIGLPLVDYYFKTLFMTAAKSSIPLIAFCFVFRHFIKPDYGNLAAIAAIQSALFLPLTIFFILNGRERQLLRNILFKRV